MNRNERDGKLKEFKGKAKQVVADVTNNPRLHDEGVGDEVAGKTQNTVGRAGRKVGEAIEKIGVAVKR